MRLIRIPTILNLSIAALYLVALSISFYKGPEADTDFSAFYTGWSIVRDGRGSELYNIETQREYQSQIDNVTPDEQIELVPYINPPHFVVPFLPLSFISRINAARIWRVLQFVLIGLTIRKLWLLTSNWTEDEKVCMVSAFLAAPMLPYTLYQGAFSLLILLALTYVYAAEKDKPASGAWLAIATIKPQLVLLPAVGLLARNRHRTLVGLAGISLLIVVLSLPFVGFRAYWEYPKLLRIVGSEFSIRYAALPTNMTNLKGLLCNLLGLERDRLINTLVYAGVFGSLLLTVYLWRRGRATTSLKFALTVLLGLFVAPHLNEQDVLVAVLPAVLLYDHVRDKPRRRIVGFALSVLPAVTVLTRAQDRRVILVLLIVLLLWASVELYVCGSRERKENANLTTASQKTA